MRVLQIVWFFVLTIVLCVVNQASAVPSNAVEKAIKSLGKKFDKLIAAVNVIAYGKPTIKPGKHFASCKEIYNNHKSEGNKAYLLQMHSRKVPVYCHMSSHGLGACGGGGWTLVMKTDGNKQTFHFNSKLWSNQVDFNLPGGKTLFDNHETKLPTYWNTPFSKICLGMKIGHQTRFIMVSKRARSLHALIADGN